MGVVKNGATVQVHYTGELTDGTVFDSSRDREPLTVTVGAGEVIPGFEHGLLGMTVGELKTLTLAPDQAYGHRRDELVIEVNANQFPDHIVPKIGERLQVDQPDGSTVNVQITAIDDGMVTLDANHPLAGETLVFHIEIVAVD